MTELGDIFVELGLSQYLDIFVEHGFDTWDTILDITESDFDTLGVKLGHRRKLQRKIANSRGFSSDRALLSPTRITPVDERQSDENKAIAKADAKDGGIAHSGKRKYRRHPKPDENAPERPPSAYVIFSNKMRVDLKGRNLSFTEIAKLVGENWQNLSPSEKEPYEVQASSAKDKYNTELAEYKKTENYRKYAEYLQQFKERQSSLQHVADAAKRPRLEHQISTGSSSAGNSAEGQQGSDVTRCRARGGSTGSVAAFKLSSGGEPSPSTQLSSLSNLNTGHDGPIEARGQGSPNARHSHSTVLPGYRDAIFGTAQQQALAWRDNARVSDASSPPQFSHIMSIGERRSGQPTVSNIDSSNQFRARSQGGHRTGPDFSPPPLSTSESTAGTAMSSGTSASGSSSLYHMPRTPLEPPLERQLPISAIYPSKPYENQLPPLRSISLSPQSSVNVSYNSPSGIPVMDYPSAPSRSGYVSSSQPQGGSLAATDLSARLVPPNGADEEVLDPVSALLKADEIVNRTSRSRPPT